MTRRPSDEELFDAVSQLQDALVLAIEYIHSRRDYGRFDDTARRVVLDRAAAALETIRRVTGGAV